MNSPRRIALYVLTSLTLIFSPSARAQQQLLPSQSEIVFVSKQMGVPVEGKFKTFDAKISFDPTKPAAGKIAFTVDMASATLGLKETDAELVKADWFNTTQFSQASFQSSTVKAVGTGKFEVGGALNIKGLSQNLVVPVTLTQTGATTTAVGSFTLKRLNFKIGENEWADTSMVADDVLVKFKFAISGMAKF